MPRPKSAVGVPYGGHPRAEDKSPDPGRGSPWEPRKPRREGNFSWYEQARDQGASGLGKLIVDVVFAKGGRWWTGVGYECDDATLT